LFVMIHCGPVVGDGRFAPTLATTRGARQLAIGARVRLGCTTGFFG
jgi:hypothetical protein